MKTYNKQGRPSGVSAYEIGNDSIKIRFVDGSIYLYNFKTTGKQNVERMKKLAEAGKGLATFINKHVRKKFAAHLV
jgi:hypothetical protein